MCLRVHHQGAVHSQAVRILHILQVLHLAHQDRIFSLDISILVLGLELLPLQISILHIRVIQVILQPLDQYILHTQVIQQHRLQAPTALKDHQPRRHRILTTTGTIPTPELAIIQGQLMGNLQAALDLQHHSRVDLEITHRIKSITAKNNRVLDLEEHTLEGLPTTKLCLRQDLNHQGVILILLPKIRRIRMVNLEHQCMADGPTTISIGHLSMEVLQVVHKLLRNNGIKAEDLEVLGL